MSDAGIGREGWRFSRRAAARVEANVAGHALLVLVHEIQDDDVFGMAAEMAYRFLFAIFPMLLFLVTAIGFLGNLLGLNKLFDQLLAQVSPFLPSQVADMIDRYLSYLLEKRSPTFLTIGLLGTLWGAAGGVGTLIKGLNRAYDVEQSRPFWRRQILALAVTLTVPPAALLLLGLGVLGHALADWLQGWLGLQSWIADGLALARWPVLFLVLLFSLSMMYHVLPNVRHRYLWSLPGSLLATVIWLVLTQAFSMYVENFGNYDATYGSFGAAIAFLLWLYLVGVVVLLGAEVNAVLAEKRGSPSMKSSTGSVVDNRAS